MTVLIVLAVAATLAAALTDARTGHIPNWITFGAFFGGFLVHGILAFQGGGVRAVPGALLSCIIGAALCALVPLFMYRARAIGAGDLKLFIALGAIAHSMMGLEIELCGFVAGSLIAPMRLAWEGKLLNTLKRSFYVFMNPILPKSRRKEFAADSMTWFRLGPAIFLGTAWVAFSSLEHALSIRKNTEGAVMVEFLVAFLPVMTFAMCIFQQTVLYAGQLLTEHAALSAARAASVVVPDNPNRYGGEGANTAGTKRKEAVRLAAIRSLAPLVQNENISEVTVDMGTGAIGAKSPINVTVNATFQCKVPLAAQIICDSNGEFKLSAQATLPNQGANFTYED